MEAARTATADDLPALVELASALRAELREQRGGALWSLREARPEPLEDSLRALLGEPGCDCLAALDSSEGEPED